MASTAQGKMSIRRQLKRRYAPGVLPETAGVPGWHVWVAGGGARHIGDNQGAVSRCRSRQHDRCSLDRSSAAFHHRSVTCDETGSWHIRTHWQPDRAVVGDVFPAVDIAARLKHSSEIKCAINRHAHLTSQEKK
jgi:hypothetical protein